MSRRPTKLSRAIDWKRRGESNENENVRLLDRSSLFVFGWSYGREGARTTIQKDQRRHLRLHGTTQRLQVTIIETQEGVVLIDTGQTPKDSHVVMAALKKLTSRPVRFIIYTEPHSDHTVGNFVFSLPAIIIAHQGATDSMRKAENPATIEKRAAASPEMQEAYKDIV